jgi:hypothetical protein
MALLLTACFRFSETVQPLLMMFDSTVTEVMLDNQVLVPSSGCFLPHVQNSSALYPMRAGIYFTGTKRHQNDTEHWPSFSIEVNFAWIYHQAPNPTPWVCAQKPRQIYLLKMPVFRDVGPCTLVDIGRRFRGACYLRRRDDGSSKLLWNVGHYLSDYTVQHPWRQTMFIIVAVRTWNHTNLPLSWRCWSSVLQRRVVL